MSKKLLATNCTIIDLPKGCTAKVDGKGTAIINLPANFESIFTKASYSMEAFIDGLYVVSFDKETMLCLGDAPADFDETGFHDFPSN